MFLLPQISHASSSVVVIINSSAKEQSSCNEVQLQCLTTHDLTHFVGLFVSESMLGLTRMHTFALLSSHALNG